MPYLIDDDILAFTRNNASMQEGEKRLLASAVMEAREKSHAAVKGMEAAVARLSAGDGPLQPALEGLLERAFKISEEASTKGKIKRMQEMLKRLKDTDKGLQARLQIVDVPLKMFKANLALIAKSAQARAAAADAIHRIPQGAHLELKKDVGPVVVANGYTLNAQVAKSSEDTQGALGYVRTPPIFANGRIHVAFGFLFDQSGSAWTIYHEATHKFAGTDDKAYWLGTEWEKPLSISNAIKNADSYALFAMEYKH